MSPWHQHIARIKELSRACVVPFGKLTYTKGSQSGPLVKEILQRMLCADPEERTPVCDQGALPARLWEFLPFASLPKVLILHGTEDVKVGVLSIVAMCAEGMGSLY